MPTDFEVSQLRRRATDNLPTQVHPQCACGKEVFEILDKMSSDIRDIKHGLGTIRTAFVRNDLGDPDFEGHRQEHIAIKNRHTQIESIKTAGTLKILGIIGVLALAVFGTGLSTHFTRAVQGAINESPNTNNTSRSPGPIEPSYGNQPFGDSRNQYKQ